MQWAKSYLRSGRNEPFCQSCFALSTNKQDKIYLKFKRPYNVRDNLTESVLIDVSQILKVSQLQITILSCNNFENFDSSAFYAVR